MFLSCGLDAPLDHKVLLSNTLRDAHIACHLATDMIKRVREATRQSCADCANTSRKVTTTCAFSLIKFQYYTLG